jgi:transposase-like protein
MYLLDRSTYRRVGTRQAVCHTTALRALQRAIGDMEYQHKGWSSGFVVLDGKRLSIKGREWCEYLVLDSEGDLLIRALEPGKECAVVYGELLGQLKADGLIVSAAVTDGLPGLRKVLRNLSVIHQRCHVHLLRDLRTGLRLTTRHRHKRLTPANRQKRILYGYAKLLLQATRETFELRLYHLTRCVAQNHFCLNPIQLQALRRFLRGAQSAFWHFHDDRIPTTTNAVENYIGRLEARLKTMRGFKNPDNADRVLRALHMDLNWTA